MEPLAFDDLPEQALLLVDSAPIIYLFKIIRSTHRTLSPYLRLMEQGA